jgi:hypothetical protein
MEKETPRQIALRTYEDQIALGLKETPQSWFLWKRAFDIANKEFKNNVALHNVSKCNCKKKEFITDDLC